MTFTRHLCSDQDLPRRVPRLQRILFASWAVYELFAYSEARNWLTFERYPECSSIYSKTHSGFEPANHRKQRGSNSHSDGPLNGINQFAKWLPGMDSNHELDKILKARKLLILRSR